MSTPIYGFPYPSTADPIAEAPQNFQDLAEAVETAIAGAVGGGFSYVQAVPAATWTIPNPLGRYPRSALILVGVELVDTDIEFPDLSTIVVTFASPQSGRAEFV